ncbi:MAG: TldD/PmbA family protein [Bacteroidales bacterium]|nr:TldD/PmbA family protein [Bacteroidales bacterium]
MITAEELELTRQALRTAREAGAQNARATLNKSTEDLIATLNGEVDKVTHCEDRSLSLSLFVDGRYGSFSTNRLEKDSLREFIFKAAGITRLLAEDPCRHLPSPDRQCRAAVTGQEMQIFDPGVENIRSEDRIASALGAAAFGKGLDDGKSWKLVSEEGEYSDTVYDMFVADTQGLECRHTETCLDYGVEVTIEDEDGEKYSGYWWDSAPDRAGFDASACGAEALRRASSHIGSDAVQGGRYNMVVESDVASKMVSPILRALSGYSIQLNDSFLMDAIGKQIFPEGLTIMDCPHILGQTGSKLFDSEGVATEEAPIIDKGTVSRYFINTYMAEKLGMQPTVEEAIRPKVMPWPRPGMSRQDLLDLCGSGILVTDFNGGNSNTATGDFSYGIEGFLFENGKIVKPVSEMLVTGNFRQLWQGLLGIADDARSCMSKLIPTLAFSNVDFNG